MRKRGRMVRAGSLFLLAVTLWMLSAFEAEFQSLHRVSAQSAAGASAPVSETVMNGWRWFHVYCFRCHGVDALGSQLAPNLRESITKLKPEEFTKTVREGRPNTAMQAWKALLDDSQIEDIYQYVLARSEGRLRRGRPDEQ